MFYDTFTIFTVFSIGIHPIGDFRKLLMASSRGFQYLSFKLSIIKIGSKIAQYLLKNVILYPHHSELLLTFFILKSSLSIVLERFFAGMFRRVQAFHFRHNFLTLVKKHILYDNFSKHFRFFNRNWSLSGAFEFLFGTFEE